MVWNLGLKAQATQRLDELRSGATLPSSWWDHQWG